MVQPTQPIPSPQWNRSIGWNLDRQGMQVTEIITDGADCYPWREVFALWPVKTINGKYIWWKKVFKRKVWLVWGHSFHMEPETQYATVFDMIEDPHASLGR